MPNSCIFDRIKQQLGQPEYLLSILSSAERTILPNSVCSPRTTLLQNRLIYVDKKKQCIIVWLGSCKLCGEYLSNKTVSPKRQSEYGGQVLNVCQHRTHTSMHSNKKSISVNPNKKLQMIKIFGLKIPHVQVQILTGHAPVQPKNTKLAIDIGLDTDERS